MMCIICIYGILFNFSIGSCSANVDTCLVYIETLWISLDTTTEQRKQVDEIIGEATRDLKSLEQRSKFGNIFDIMEFESSLNDRRLIVNDKIMQVLSMEQQEMFSSQLKKQQQYQNISTAALLNLDLSESQSLQVLQALITSQKQVWSIVSDRSTSWEARRRKLNNINIFNNISSLLTKKQLIDLNLWSESLKLLQRQSL